MTSPCLRPFLIRRATLIGDHLKWRNIAITLIDPGRASCQTSLSVLAWLRQLWVSFECPVLGACF
jgi:hypothetical protein